MRVFVLKIPTLNNENEILWLPIWLPIHSRGFAELLSMRVVGICCSAFESPMSHYMGKLIAFSNEFFCCIRITFSLKFRGQAHRK